MCCCGACAACAPGAELGGGHAGLEHDACAERLESLCLNRVAWAVAEEAHVLPRRLCSLRAWRWAAATLASRTMHLPGDAAGALAPFADLHNHRPSPGPEPPAIGVDRL